MDTETLKSRRDNRGREIRRRGRLATALLAAIVAAALIALLLGGSSGSRRSTPAGASAARSSGSAEKINSHATRASSGGVPTGHPGTAAVPILMYHVIAAPPAGAPFPGLYVTPELFAAQMQALRRAGWTAVTLDQVESNWRKGLSLPAGKPIVLSFDNGYHSHYTQAMPVLRRLGWVGDENIQLTGLPPSQGGLGDDEVRGLLAAGWELDTQGISHADLIALDARQLREQVAGARAILRRRYGVPVNWFCYPSGHYDATVIDAVRAAGYRGSTTVVPGWGRPADDPYRLPRLRVLGGTAPQALLTLIASIRDDPPAPPSYNGA
jgi:peptidoglycan/xylan/chitin deacetylase (PgdA/CDA1 family)